MLETEQKFRATYFASFFALAGYSCNNSWSQVRGLPGTVQRLFNIGCSCGLPICCSVRMVMGSSWLDNSK